MKKLLLWSLMLVGAGQALYGQNMVGTWQGSLPGPADRPALRLVVKVTRADDESLKATLYSIDQGGQALNANAMTLQGTNVKISINAIGATYEGKLGADGNSITGTWSQGGPGMALNLLRATAETAWTIPEPPPPQKSMAADAKPSFEVATIKPTKPEIQGNSILVGRGGTNLFTTTHTSLADLIVFAYGLHPRQVSNGPSWLENEYYDVTAKPDQPGIPNVNQLRLMVQKLLEDRFQLTFHYDKKELSAYAITVAKGGVKMSVSEGTGILPGFSGRGRGGLSVRNSTMTEFASFLQSRVLERPVVDQTSLTARYDFTLQWTPDGAAPAPAVAADGAVTPDAPPDLFGAMQQQLGLKVESTKAPVDVMVIDKVQKPSEN